MDAELRETLGKVVRDTWVKWAEEQPNPKPSWLVPWEQLAEGDKEVDRRIGEAVSTAMVDQLHPRVQGAILAEYARNPEAEYDDLPRAIYPEAKESKP